MDSLLKRQIRKYLSEPLKNNKDLEHFLDAVNRSYINFNDQYNMQQLAMTISSDELFKANEQLKKEAEAQKKVINKLKHVIETLKFYKLPEDVEFDNSDINGLKLVEFINNQTKEIIKINKQREKLLSELEHQNQELNDYAHMVSHDLKSPLRSIDALTAWLREDYGCKLGEQGAVSINLIRSNVEKMDTLISGILEYSTITKNQTTLYDVDLDKLIDNTISIMFFPDHIKVKKINRLPKVKGDKYRLQQLFQNLIDNAIKYNNKTKGSIEIGVVDIGEFWQFYVKDNGKGIEKVYFDKIFKTFQKLENNVNSSGIGLSIVKKIVSLYGGQVWLKSEINKGTTFYFTLKK